MAPRKFLCRKAPGCPVLPSDRNTSRSTDPLARAQNFPEKALQRPCSTAKSFPGTLYGCKLLASNRRTLPTPLPRLRLTIFFEYVRCGKQTNSVAYKLQVGCN